MAPGSVLVGARGRGRKSNFRAAGVDVDALAATLQGEGAQAFVKSWQELLDVIGAKSVGLQARR